MMTLVLIVGSILTVSADARSGAVLLAQANQTRGGVGVGVEPNRPDLSPAQRKLMAERAADVRAARNAMTGQADRLPPGVREIPVNGNPEHPVDAVAQPDARVEAAAKDQGATKLIRTGRVWVDGRTGRLEVLGRRTADGVTVSRVRVTLSDSAPLSPGQRELLLKSLRKVEQLGDGNATIVTRVGQRSFSCSIGHGAPQGWASTSSRKHISQLSARDTPELIALRREARREQAKLDAEIRRELGFVR